MAECVEREVNCFDNCFHNPICLFRIDGSEWKKCIHFKNKADVVEVVRCKDCVHRDKKGVCEKFRQRYPFFPEDDFHCSYGEAKMDGKGEGE